MTNALKLAEPLFNPETIGEAIYQLIQGKFLNLEAQIQAANAQMQAANTQMQAQLADANEIMAGLEQIAQDSASVSIIKPGMVLISPTSIIPVGFAECDGSYIKRTDAPNLYAGTPLSIGDMYGAPSTLDGQPAFKLPDYRGMFLRGYDHGRGKDPDRNSRADRGDGTLGDNIGTIQPSENKIHSHEFRESCINSNGQQGVEYVEFTDDTVPYQSGASLAISIPGMRAADKSNLNNAGQFVDLKIGTSGGSETRPENIYVTFIIKL